MPKIPFFSISGLSRLFLLFSLIWSANSFAQEHTSLTKTQLLNMLNNKEILLIDVRTPEEFEQGHLKDSILIEYQNIEQEITKYTTDKNKPIALYCRSGRRSGVAAMVLNRAGYINIVNIGGYEALKQEGYPVE
ncbi:MAG: rhodanese-like domain-containing protein [Saezia sp.]